VDTVIPIFGQKVESLLSVLLPSGTLIHNMDKEALMVTLFFTFMLGAGVGFYLVRFIF
jgi:hypothetical protein